MKADPIVEEIWRIKDELACEAGFDVHRLCENTRKWAAEHPHAGRVIRTTEELRQFVADNERSQSALTLNDKPSAKS